MLFTVHSPNQHSQMVFQQYHTPFSKYWHAANDVGLKEGEITLYSMLCPGEPTVSNEALLP